MALDINTIKPASLKAKNVATEEYVDSSIQDIDLSADLLYNNNEFASKLGYIGTGTITPYEEMIADATAGKTIINGGRLNTELIEANSINAGHIDAYAIAGKTITGGTINGTVINGVQINGAIIKGSFIDYTTSLALTNWQEYTASTIPSLYVNNFAHHNDGSLVVDSMGYARLPGQANFIVGQVVKNGTTNGNITLDAIYDLYSWNSYNINTLQRSLRSDTTFTSSATLKITVSGSANKFSTMNNWGITVNFTLLNIAYALNVSSYASNAHTSAQTHLYANGVEVAGAIGSLGVGLDKPWDSGWIDYSSSTKGIPINVKTKILGNPIDIDITIPITSLTPILGHSLNDVIKVTSIASYSNNGGSGHSINYNVNFPTIWVQ